MYNEKINEILKYTILKFDHNHDFLIKTLDYSNDITIIDIIRIFYTDYFMFLTNNFFNKNMIFNFKKSLLKYFDKYNVLYFNYEDKNKIINLLSIFNLFVKYSTNIEKNNFINAILISNNDKLKKYFDISKKLKFIYFSENIFEPNILYKKIKFSNQEILIPFENYVIKKMEYKLRTFCQIAEKLGAKKIKINYQSLKNNHSKIDLNLDILSHTNISANISDENQNNENIQIVFEYPNNHSDINLNKFYIINSIINENEFLITKEDFESDLELKFLIDARCINFIQKYNTLFIINSMNKIERKIFVKAHNYGITIDKVNLNNHSIKINIIIDFIQIQDNYDIIDGTNIYVLREGFIHLSNIIKKDNKYSKLLRFLQSHIDSINKKLIFLNYEYDNTEIVNKIYNDIINLNFNENEIISILEKYFENNLTWYNFKKFRDIILKGSDDKIEKLYFVSFQYNDILNNKKHIMNDIKKYIDFYLNDFIDSFSKIQILEYNDIYSFNNKNSKKDNYNENNFDISYDNLQEYNNLNIIDISNNNDDYFKILNFLKDNNNNKNIKNILYISFKKSFEFKNGLSDNLSDSTNLINVILNIINYYFDNNIKNLQSTLNNNLNNEPKYNLKINIFNKLIELISLKIIDNINLTDTSPNVNFIDNKNNETKLTLYNRIQKIFSKYIIRYFTFENNINKILKKLDLEDEDFDNNIFFHFLEKHISINKVFKNYDKHKLFYTWDDFNYIRNYFM